MGMRVIVTPGRVRPLRSHIQSVTTESGCRALAASRTAEAQETASKKRGRGYARRGDDRSGCTGLAPVRASKPERRAEAHCGLKDCS